MRVVYCVLFCCWCSWLLLVVVCCDLLVDCCFSFVVCVVCVLVVLYSLLCVNRVCRVSCLPLVVRSSLSVVVNCQLWLIVVRWLLLLASCC